MPTSPSTSFGRGRGLLPRTAVLALALLALGGANSGGPYLVFRRAVEGSEPFPRNFGAYDRVVREHTSWQEGIFYVERTLALRLDSADIRSVPIAADPLATNEAERLKSLSGTWSAEEIRRKEEKGELFFTVTIWLTTEAAPKVREFTGKPEHQNQRFDVKFNNQRLGFVVLRGQHKGTSLSLQLIKLERKRLEGMFSPVKGKVKWE